MIQNLVSEKQMLYISEFLRKKKGKLIFSPSLDREFSFVFFGAVLFVDFMDNIEFH